MENLSTALASWVEFHRQIGVDLEALLLPGASEAQIVEVEDSLGHDLPAELKSLYRIANGQVDLWNKPELISELGDVKRVAAMFGHFRFLTLQEALAEHREQLVLHEEDDAFEPWGLRPDDAITPVDWRPEWFAFAAAEAGNGYAVDVAPPEGGAVGQIIQVGPDFERHLIASSLSELMSQAAARIPLNQAGRFAEDPCEAQYTFDYVEFNMDWNWEPPVPPSAEQIASAAIAYKNSVR